jgi:primosomal protein N' (replication factor Y) (superfamily II helicase)
LIHEFDSFSSMNQKYADVAFPTAVRRVFTYEIEDSLKVERGTRVWVPLRNKKAIGMIVRIHNEKPDFKTKSIIRCLDESPVMDPFLLELTEWIHRFYYCSWGETIQAALPVGLNFVSEKRLKVNQKYNKPINRQEEEVLNDLSTDQLSLKEAKKRWRDSRKSRVLKDMIEKGLLEIWEEPKQKVDYKTEKYWDWTPNGSADVKSKLESYQNKQKPKWIQALEYLKNVELPESHQKLINHELLSDYTLRRIEKEKLIVSKQVKTSSDSISDELHEPGKINTLSGEQSDVFDQIKDKIHTHEFHSFLLYGVTGSGKTEVYIHALKEALDHEKGGMVLVPEIALTPQTVRRFYQIFGDRIAVIHSRLNDRERFEAWQGLQSGEKKVVIGPRSAVFAPVKNLGIIIVDEEHDGSYKQFDPAPRYHARDVAIMRAYIEDAVVLMGSATPSMAALQGVLEKKHTLLNLPSRPGGSMPDVHVLDMKKYSSAMRGPLTVELYQAIEKALNQDEQVILLYNRRGFASYLQCEDCGHIPQSPDCSVSLTYHKQRKMLLCHYSGYARRVDSVCEVCGSENLRARGSGTQQLEDEISKLFPEATLLRMDKDTTSGKYDHQKIYETFLSGQADILIGTQLVSKGLDFPNVTVVGVINAETELAFPSFRSGERMFQLLSQVAGRAGRGSKAGRVYVQTWKPDHRAIRYAKTHDYRSFAKEEMDERKSLNYPPFTRMIRFQFKGVKSALTQQVAETFSEAVRTTVPDQSVLGPSPGVIEKIHGMYQWESQIKVSPKASATKIEYLIDQIFRKYENRKVKGSGSVRISVNVDVIE